MVEAKKPDPVKRPTATPKMKYYLSHPQDFEEFDTLAAAENRFNQLTEGSPMHPATDPDDIMIIKGYELKTKFTILDV